MRPSRGCGEPAKDHGGASAIGLMLKSRETWGCQGGFLAHLGVSGPPLATHLYFRLPLCDLLVSMTLKISLTGTFPKRRLPQLRTKLIIMERHNVINM